MKPVVHSLGVHLDDALKDICIIISRLDTGLSFTQLHMIQKVHRCIIRGTDRCSRFLSAQPTN